VDVFVRGREETAHLPIAAQNRQRQRHRLHDPEQSQPSTFANRIGGGTDNRRADTFTESELAPGIVARNKERSACPFAAGQSSRIDPRSPGFGAVVFDVDGIPDNPDLIGVTGHEPILHSV
jgi:hypothetical protein